MATAPCARPGVIWLVLGLHGEVVLGLALVTVGVAEIGRRRAGGTAVHHAATAWLARLWVAERAVCVLPALASRRALGGCRSRGTVIRRAAVRECAHA